MDVSPILTAVVWVGAGLLVLAGAMKLRTPDAAMAALHSLRLPSGRVAARLLGLGEIAAGAAVVLLGGRTGAALAALVYLGLAGVAARQRARQIDCGCFGVRRYPVSRLHVGVNTVVAVVAAVAAALPSSTLWSLTDLTQDAGLLGTAAAAVLLATAVGLLTVMMEQAGLAEAPRVRARTTAAGT